MEEREQRKLRIKWTPNLNEKFNEAIRRLGEKATAIPILEYMNVPQLNRKQVENRLQQYRVQKRQAQLAQHASSSLVVGNHPNALNSHEFLMNFNTPPQESSLPQTHPISSLVPPNEFFTGLDELIQKLEFELYSKMSENHFNVLKTNDLTMNFNEPHQNVYLPVIPPNDLFTSLEHFFGSSPTQDNISIWNQNP